MSISSEEVNFLIQRYFQECGFEHSFYTFNAESPLDYSNINGSQIPRGALITLLEKGLLYIQLEKSINSGNQTASSVFNSQLTLLDAALREGAVPVPKQEPTVDSSSIPLDASNSITLTEHSGDAVCCAWTSDNHYLATGSSDNTAIIYDFEDPNHITNITLSHGSSSSPSDRAQHQVSSLNFSPDNEHLVTGCSDGSVHMWTIHGESLYIQSESSAAIHIVKFDPSGKRFFSGNSESQLIVYVSENGEIIRNFAA